MKFLKKFKFLLNRKRFNILSFFLCCPVLFLGACASQEYIPLRQVEYIKVPEYLLVETPEPSLQGTRNQDLVELILNYKEALLLCNGDKEQIKAFNLGNVSP